MTETLFLYRGTPSALGSETKHSFRKLNAGLNRTLKTTNGGDTPSPLRSLITCRRLHADSPKFLNEHQRVRNICLGSDAGVIYTHTHTHRA